MSKPLVVILNGPPGCGKDTIANAWLEKTTGNDEFRPHVKAFKEPMYRVAAAALGLPLYGFMELYNDREWKERSRPEWGGKSVRDLMIATSESYLKPMFGDTCMGKLAVSSIKQQLLGQKDVIVFSDGGFKAEVSELEEHFHVQVVQILRDDCSFEGDSRSYIEGSQRNTYYLVNDSTVEDAVDYLNWIVERTRRDLYV
ncbi:dNMP kinase [Escherichia phage 4E8]|nr:dNMP kinase [Escherichia phage 4E8]